MRVSEREKLRMRRKEEMECVREVGGERTEHMH